jgi:hypothetical protein
MTKTQPMSDSDFNPNNLDPGVRQLVIGLRKLGIPTSDSGDGVSKEHRVLDIPHVFACYTAFTGCGRSFALDQAATHADLVRQLLPEKGDGGDLGGRIEVSWDAYGDTVVLAILGWSDADIVGVDWDAAKPTPKSDNEQLEVLVPLKPETAGHAASCLRDKLRELGHEHPWRKAYSEAVDALQAAADGQARGILGDLRAALGFDRDDGDTDIGDIIEAVSDLMDKA